MESQKCLKHKSELNTVLTSDLGLKSFYLLAAPTTSKEARDEIITRAARGEKLKHKEIAAVVRKTKKPKTPSGLKAEIIKTVQAAGAKGLTTDELKTKIAHRHPQTVNSATNALAKADILQDSGERRETSSGGGRPAIVYRFNPDPNPDPQRPVKSKPANKVVDLGARKVPQLIEQLGLATERMSHSDRAKVAYQIVKRLRISTANVYAFEYREARKAGLVQEIHFTKEGGSK